MASEKELREAEDRVRELELERRRLLDRWRKERRDTARYEADQAGYALVEIADVKKELRGQAGKIECICSRVRVYFPGEVKQMQADLLRQIDAYSDAAEKLLSQYREEVHKKGERLPEIEE